jgi:hypothetical protein
LRERERDQQLRAAGATRDFGDGTREYGYCPCDESRESVVVRVSESTPHDPSLPFEC